MESKSSRPNGLFVVVALVVGLCAINVFAMAQPWLVIAAAAGMLVLAVLVSSDHWPASSGVKPSAPLLLVCGVVCAFLGVGGVFAKQKRDAEHVQKETSSVAMEARPAPPPPTPARPASAPQEREWYEGGTLHRATVREWRRADDDDKLATSADWVAAFLQAESRREPDSLNELRHLASELVDCVDEATRDGNVDRESAATVAASCAIIMRIR